MDILVRSMTIANDVGMVEMEIGDVIIHRGPCILDYGLHHSLVSDSSSEDEQDCQAYMDEIKSGLALSQGYFRTVLL